MSAKRPMQTKVDFETGIMEPSDRITKMKLNDMAGAFNDSHSFDSVRGEENAVVYEVSERRFPEGVGHLAHAVTAIRPGAIGSEYYMTLGHFHREEIISELHIILRGEGYLLFMNKKGDFESMKVKPSRLAYVPPGWAHRVVNTGRQELVILSVFPADADHDPHEAGKLTFPVIVVEEDGQPVLAENPKYAKSAKR